MLWKLIKDAIRDIEMANDFRLGNESWQRLKQLEKDIYKWQYDNNGEMFIGMPPKSERKVKIVVDDVSICQWCESAVDANEGYPHKGQWYCNKDHAYYYDYGTDAPTEDELAESEDG